MPDKRLYRRISLELMSQYPGKIFLRLEPFPEGSPAIMLEVYPDDLQQIKKLSEWGE